MLRNWRYLRKESRSLVLSQWRLTYMKRADPANL